MDVYTAGLVTVALWLLWRDIARSASLDELQAQRAQALTAIHGTRAAVRQLLVHLRDRTDDEVERRTLEDELRRW